MDFQVVTSDASHDFSRLWAVVGQNGVRDIDSALEELTLQPVIAPWNQIINKGFIDFVLKHITEEYSSSPKLRSEFGTKTDRFLNGIQEITHISFGKQPLIDAMNGKLNALIAYGSTSHSPGIPGSSQYRKIAASASKDFSSIKWLPAALISWVVLSEVSVITNAKNGGEQILSWIDEWHLGNAVEKTLKEYGFSDNEVHSALLAIKIAIRNQNWISEALAQPIEVLLRKLVSDIDVQNFIQENRYNDILWFNREAFLELLTILQAVAVVDALKANYSNSALAEKLIHVDGVIRKIKLKVKRSGYQVLNLLK